MSAIGTEYYMMVKPYANMPVGSVVTMVAGGIPIQMRDSMVACEGQDLQIRDYPDVYAVVGDAYDRPVNVVKTYLWGLIKVKRPNPDAQPVGTFRMPDMRGRTI